MSSYVKKWDQFWSKEKYAPLVSYEKASRSRMYGGTNIEPLASIGMSYFLSPVEDLFNDGFSIIDYGCGAGILSNFISSRLKYFNYVGLEPNNQHGNERLSIAKRLINDNRVRFGYVDDISDYEENFDCIIMISVFTHLTIEKIYSILDDLKPKIKNGSKLIFSCFISDRYELLIPQPSIAKNFYGVSKITIDQLNKYVDDNELKIEKCDDFVAQGGYVHNIFKIEANNDK